MAVARTSLRGFLTQAKTRLQNGPTSKSPTTFVIGNESADLDSISSAIIYSYLATITPQYRQSPTFHIPLLNIPSADLSLRPELSALFPLTNIDKSHLLTLDDLGDPSLLPDRFPPPSTRWILVDHNRLQGQLGQTYASRVVGVIDHHDDEECVPKDTGDEPRIIATCGSCTSLIVRHFAQRWDAMSLGVMASGAANGQGDSGSVTEDGAVAAMWDAQVARFALAAVLADTAGLKDEHKTTDADREVVGYLEAKVGMCGKMGKEYDREKYWNLVQEAKMDLDGLSVRDVLRKDYKEWRETGADLGTAAVVRGLDWMQGKAKKEKGSEGLMGCCRAFAEEKGLDIMAVVTAHTDDEGAFHRELAMVSRTEKGRRVIERFVDESSEDLKLEESLREDKDESCLWFMWQQGNLSASRKQVAPRLRKAMAACQ